MNIFSDPPLLVVLCIKLVTRCFPGTGKAILKSNKKESWRVPNRPADVSLTSPDEIGALEISVTSGRSE